MKYQSYDLKRDKRLDVQIQIDRNEIHIEKIFAFILDKYKLNLLCHESFKKEKISLKILNNNLRSLMDGIACLFDTLWERKSGGYYLKPHIEDWNVTLGNLSNRVEHERLADISEEMEKIPDKIKLAMKVGEPNETKKVPLANFSDSFRNKLESFLKESYDESVRDRGKVNDGFKKLIANIDDLNIAIVNHKDSKGRKEIKFSIEDNENHSYNGMMIDIVGEQREKDREFNNPNNYNYMKNSIKYNDNVIDSLTNETKINFEILSGKRLDCLLGILASCKSVDYITFGSQTWDMRASFKFQNTLLSQALSLYGKRFDYVVCDIRRSKLLVFRRRRAWLGDANGR